MDKNNFLNLNSQTWFFDGLFEELKNIWADAGEERIWYHTTMNVYAAANYRRTYCALFGSHPEFRGGIRAKVARIKRRIMSKEWLGPLQVSLRIPDDAVILSPGINGVVIASVKKEVVVKIVTHAGSFGHLDNEINAWSLAKEAGIERYVPRMIDHGTTCSGNRWMVSEIAPNLYPLHKPVNPFLNVRKKWREVLHNEVVPVLRRFYESAGLEIVDADELFEEELDNIGRMNGLGPIRRMIRLTESAGSFRGKRKIARSIVHGDLVPEHIHRNDAGWRLIDWGLMHKTEIPYEFFIDYLWHPESENINIQAFWKWLKGDLIIRDLPIVVRTDIEQFLTWYNAWLHFETGEDLLRYQLLINTLRLINKHGEKHNLYDFLNGNFYSDSFRSLDRLGRNALRKLEVLGAIEEHK